MAPKSSNQCEWIEADGGHWLCSGGQLEHLVKITSAELEAQFPTFHSAVVKLCENTDFTLVGAEDTESLFGLAGLALTETSPRRQRYQLYRALACYFGYKDRTQLPEELENAVRAQWSEPGEIFVGFQPDV